MNVTLKHFTPLEVCAAAVRTCWASEGKSDTQYARSCIDCGSTDIDDIMSDTIEECQVCKSINIQVKQVCGENDKALIERVGNKFKHASTLEHLNYTFYIEGVSRALLQELARHRMASPSVKSTRYTLKELKNEELISILDLNVDIDSDILVYDRPGWVIAHKYLVSANDATVDYASYQALSSLQLILKQGTPNDKAKYCLPESYKTSLAWTINARSLQNFLSLRSSKAALWEIRDLANAIYEALPFDHQYLYTDCMSVES